MIPLHDIESKIDGFVNRMGSSLGSWALCGSIAAWAHGCKLREEFSDLDFVTKLSSFDASAFLSKARLYTCEYIHGRPTYIRHLERQMGVDVYIIPDVTFPPVLKFVLLTRSYPVIEWSAVMKAKRNMRQYDEKHIGDYKQMIEFEPKYKYLL